MYRNFYNYIRFDSLNPPFQYSRTHDSAEASLRAHRSIVPSIQLQSEAELSSVASSACGGEIHFILYKESGLCYLILFLMSIKLGHRFS